MIQKFANKGIISKRFGNLKSRSYTGCSSEGALIVVVGTQTAKIIGIIVGVGLIFF